MALFKPQNYEHLLGQWWRKDDYEYKLVGILYAEDDWYWTMCRAGVFNKHTQLLSCVGDIEAFGYDRVED